MVWSVPEEEEQPGVGVDAGAVVESVVVASRD